MIGRLFGIALLLWVGAMVGFFLGIQAAVEYTNHTTTLEVSR